MLRGLGEAPARMLEPLEIIGRRAVLAAGALAMTVMMALALSSSGPLRGERSGAFSLSRAEATESAETLLAGGVDENEEINLLPVSLNGGECPTRWWGTSRVLSPLVTDVLIFRPPYKSSTRI